MKIHNWGGEFYGIPIEEITNIKEDGTAGTVPTWKNGSWVSMAAKNTTTSFTIDLGFTPAEVALCAIKLHSNYVASTESGNTTYIHTEGFRIPRGYSSGTTTAAYYYSQYLSADSVLRAKGNYIFRGSNYNTSTSRSSYSGFGTYCSVSGSKLSFKINNIAEGSGSGVSLSTRGDKLYLSGIVAYK